MNKRKYFKRSVFIGMVVTLSVLMAGSVYAEKNPPWSGVKFLRALGGPSGSASYALYCTFAGHLNKIEGIRGSCLAGSSKPNVKAINEGKAELGYSFDVDCSDALIKKGFFKDYKKPVNNVSFVSNQFARAIGFFVRADSPIKTIEDLNSKHIAFGPKGYGANSLAYAVLDSYGITDKTIGKQGGRISKTTVSDSCSGLRDKTVDCQVLTISLTAMYKRHIPLDEMFGLRLLPIDAKHLDMTLKKYPQYPKVIIPGGLYKNQPGTYPTIGMTVNLICATKLPAELVYKICEVLYSKECRAGLYDTLKAATPVILENGLLGKGTLDIHPGALKFYKDHGITKPPEAQITPRSVKEALTKYGGQWSEDDIKWVNP